MHHSIKMTKLCMANLISNKMKQEYFCYKVVAKRNELGSCLTALIF